MRRWLFALAIACSVGLSAACERRGNAEHAGRSNPEQMARLVESGGLLLDVRTRGEVARGYLRGATNIPIDDLPSRLQRIEQLTGGAKDKAIVVYCASGGRAGRAREVLENAGYTNVHNLGGLSDWPDQSDVIIP